jgi:tetratricopeptide (TPR) repeat protein
MVAGTTLADQAFNILTQEAVNYIAPKFEEKDFKFRKIKVKEHSDMAKKAQDLMDNEDFEGAYTIYKTITEADPYNAEALANTGAIFCIYGNYAKAVEYYKQAADIDMDEYKKELDYAQTKLDELPILASIGINPPVNELQGNAHSATAKSCHTRGGKSDRYEVYTGPDAKSSVVSKIPGDTDFEILNVDGEWVMIKLLGGKQGWISKDDVKM